MMPSAAAGSGKATRLVEIEAAGADAGAIEGLEAACAAGEPFGALIDARRAAAPGRGPGRLQQVRRLRALRGGMSACAGLAFVVAPDALSDQRRVRAARVMFGCPAEAFASLPEALAWLVGRGVAVPPGTAGGPVTGGRRLCGSRRAWSRWP
jgi:hypothetical protein